MYIGGVFSCMNFQNHTHQLPTFAPLATGVKAVAPAKGFLHLISTRTRNTKEYIICYK